jgi:meromycolic acid (3R)-3-hydroxyacyl-[acyl-carrier protein] dehydratase HadB
MSPRRLKDVRAGESLPELIRVVTSEDVRAYAEAGGDRNPLHLDDSVAQAAGFPGIIAHGMFTMGHLASCIARWAGDPAAVLALSAQFRAPVFMGDRIVAGGRVRAVDDEQRTATIDAWVSVERGGATVWPIKRAEAVVQLG